MADETMQFPIDRPVRITSIRTGNVGGWVTHVLPVPVVVEAGQLVEVSFTPDGAEIVVYDTGIVDHPYISTGCLHGDHEYCQQMTGLGGAKRPGQCKYADVEWARERGVKPCNGICVCPCHKEGDVPSEDNKAYRAAAEKYRSLHPATWFWVDDQAFRAAISAACEVVRAEGHSQSAVPESSRVMRSGLLMRPEDAARYDELTS